MCSKAPFMTSVHSSGSRRSAMAVEPWTSQKRTVTFRRSPCIARVERAASSLVTSGSGIAAGAGAAAGGAWGWSAASAWPQFGQKRAAGGTAVAQFEQVRASAVPQLMQKRAFSGFAVWQEGQFKVHTLRGG